MLKIIFKVLVWMTIGWLVVDLVEIVYRVGGLTTHKISKWNMLWLMFRSIKRVVGLLTKATPVKHGVKLLCSGK